ncbi:MAG: phosphate acyltransferase PlsX [Gammaproteobacteria bacterium]|nr:phosphate acyltransferase PlsX [Gammaproteobacteria bacterium]
MGKPITISLDAMGGDHGPESVVPAAIQMAKKHPDLNLILVGQEDVLEEHLAAAPKKVRPRLRIHHASQVVEMHEPPSQALRGKKDSSMRVAINLVKEGEAEACVSAGNTGALMATGRFVLKTLAGIDRPAIISAIPAKGGHTHMLDLGANSDCSSEHLYQFAVMGSVVATAIYSIPRPTVGLLNIGEEEIKGSDTIKKAGQLLNKSSLNYIGFVEGTDIFNGRVDVVVADGFMGNVALKSAEGLSKLISHNIREEFGRNGFTKFLGLLALPVLRALKRRLDPRVYNGASLVGLRGILIKSHGSADAFAFSNAIRIAMLEVEKQVPTRIKTLLEDHVASNGQPGEADAASERSEEKQAS